MALSVVKEKTKHDGTKGVVCLETDCSGPNFSSGITELQSGVARHEAIKVAAESGLPDPRVEIAASAYPVDAEGQEVVNPMAQRVHRYRIDIPVTRRLV